jgi:serine/threonine protein kinase
LKRWKRKRTTSIPIDWRQLNTSWRRVLFAEKNEKKKKKLIRLGTQKSIGHDRKSIPRFLQDRKKKNGFSRTRKMNFKGELRHCVDAWLGTDDDNNNEAEQCARRCVDLAECDAFQFVCDDMSELLASLVANNQIDASVSMLRLLRLWLASECKSDGGVQRKNAFASDWLGRVDEVTVSLMSRLVHVRRDNDFGDELAELSMECKLCVYWWLCRWLYESDESELLLHSVLVEAVLKCGRMMREKVMSGVAELLEVVAAAVEGGCARRTVGEPLVRHESQLLSVLIPLHKHFGMIDEFTAALSQYHRALTQSMVALAARGDASTVRRIVDGLLQAASERHAKHLVLLISELEQLLEELWLRTPGGAQRYASAGVNGLVMRHLKGWLASCNFAVAQRSIALLRNEAARSLLMAQRDSATFTMLFDKLSAQASAHWNESTRRFAYEMAMRLARETGNSDAIAGNAALCALERRYAAEEAQRAAYERQRDLFQRSPLVPILKRQRIYFTDFALDKKLGEGSYGSVHLAKLITDALPARYWPCYALKIMKRSSIDGVRVANEIKALKRVSLLPGVASLSGVFEDGDRIIIALEYAPHGDLFDCISALGSVPSHSASDEDDEGDNDGGLDKASSSTSSSSSSSSSNPKPCEWLRHIAAQLLHTLADMYSRFKVVMGDIKVENICLGNDGRVRMIDFAGARFDDDGDADGALPLPSNGTLHYQAPELIADVGAPVTHKSDVFALGASLFQLVAGRTPFPCDSIEQFNALMARYVGGTLELDFPSNVDADLVALIRSTMTVDADARPSARDLLSHRFVASVGADPFGVAMPPRPLASGAVAAHEVDWRFRQRSYSMALTARLPKQYDFSLVQLSPIIKQA